MQPRRLAFLTAFKAPGKKVGKVLTGRPFCTGKKSFLTKQVRKPFCALTLPHLSNDVHKWAADDLEVAVSHFQHGLLTLFIWKKNYSGLENNSVFGVKKNPTFSKFFFTTFSWRKQWKIYFGENKSLKCHFSKFLVGNTSSPADKISGRFWWRIKNPETSDTIKWLK